MQNDVFSLLRQIKTIFLNISALFYALVFFLFFTATAGAHPLIPLEVVDYMEANPQATDAEIEQFFKERFGSIEDYYGIPPEEQDFTLKDLYTPPEDFVQQQQADTNLPEQRRIRQNMQILLSLKEKKTVSSQYFSQMISLGVRHILSGLDHILFVIALILMLPPWRKILTLITTFTIAHSLTLLLAGSGILTLSGRIVEPIIAFSIGFMAITTVFSSNKKNGGKAISSSSLKTAAATVFFFGLFHGLGFAGLLTDFQIPKERLLPSVFFFNVGIEIGQMCILLGTLPVLYFLSKTRFFRLFIQSFAIFLAIISAVWMVERIFQ